MIAARLAELRQDCTVRASDSRRCNLSPCSHYQKNSVSCPSDSESLMLQKEGVVLKPDEVRSLLASCLTKRVSDVVAHYR